MRIYPDFEARLKAVPYPNRDEIKARVFDGFDEFVGTKAQLEAREAELAEQVRDELKEGKAEYGCQHREILREFAEALSKAYGTGNQTVDDTLYSLAEDKGHSAGVAEVESYYQTFAELARVAFEAGKAEGFMTR